MSGKMDGLITLIVNLAKENPAVAQAIAGVAQAAFAFVLVIAALIQIGIYIRMRKDGVARDSAFVVMKRITAVSIADKSALSRIVFWYFMPSWENSGNTPATGLMTRINLFSDPSGIPSNFEFPDYFDPASGEIVRLVIGPKNEIGSGGIEIATDELVAVKSGNQRMFIYGWTEYDDVFRTVSFHRTEFCCEIKVEGDPTKRDCAFTFETVGEFNGADKYCYRKHYELAPVLPAGRSARLSRPTGAHMPPPTVSSEEEPRMSKRARRRLEARQRTAENNRGSGE